MRILIALFALLLPYTPAWAAPGMASEHAVTTRTDTVERRLLSSSDWGRQIELGLGYRLPARPTELPQLHIELRLPAPGPDSLHLSLDLSPAYSVYVTADLDAGLPRLDAVDQETYFTVGAALRLTRELSVFVEDFQPASMVIGGGDDDEPAPAFSWDGHQVSLGARLERGRVRLEAAAVVYALSTTQRRSGVGAVGSVTVRF